MARGRTTSFTIRLTPAERQTLRAWQRATTTIAAGRARRGRMIILLADGVPITAIATTVGISCRFVYKWVQRFVEQGLEGLTDKPGRGYPHACPGAVARGQRLRRLPDEVSMGEGYKLMAQLSSTLQGPCCASRRTVVLGACNMVAVPQRDEGSCLWQSRVTRTRSLTGS